MSAISIDLLLEEFKGSHRKKASSNKGNTAFFNNKRIRDNTNRFFIELSLDDYLYINRLKTNKILQNEHN